MKKMVWFMLVTLFIVSGCASNQEKIRACKEGNWEQIGERDGLEGNAARYAERKEFCDKQDAPGTPQAAVDYANGWAKGNQQLWFNLGEADGLKGMAAGNYVAHLSTKFMKANATPLNQPSYQAGWTQGNTNYWQAKGEKDGREGQPEKQKETQRAAALAASVGFNEASYMQGWRLGNQAYWNELGRRDARSGEPVITLFPLRVKDSNAMSLNVDEAAYRFGWENGLVEYWTNLGMNDAVSGKSFAMRKKEAMQKGLKILEKTYQTSWDNRLIQYWSEAGTQDGWGQPDFLEQRIASAARDGVFVIAQTREVYRQAWQTQHVRYCANENAFAMGRENTLMNIEVCGNDSRLSLKRAYTAGQDYEVVNAKYQRNLSELNKQTERRNQTDRRLRSLEEDSRRDLRNKDRKIDNESLALDRRREADRNEFISSLREQDRKLEELKRWEDRYSQQLRDLKRDAYSN